MGEEVGEVEVHNNHPHDRRAIIQVQEAVTMKVRLKNVVVEATQWQGGYADHPRVRVSLGGWGSIDGKPATVRPGDWIVEDDFGIHCVSDEVFRERYVRVASYKNKKTGRTYHAVADGLDCTNERSGTAVVLYFHETDPSLLFTREANEFHVKFDQMDVS